MLGDSFPVGCAPSVMLPDNKKNLDHKHPLYGTENGIYLSGCGISNLMMSWGKDESLDSKIHRQHISFLGILARNCYISIHFSISYLMRTFVFGSQMKDACFFVHEV